MAAALDDSGIEVYAWRGESEEEYYWCIDRVLDTKPSVTVDDDADLVTRVHTKRAKLLEGTIEGKEETTTGAIRLRAMEKQGTPSYPIIAVNDAQTKWGFDNVYSTGQSAIDGVLKATNILFTGKNVVVSGFGHCGRGTAMRARGLGANVIVTEADPTKALRARLEGYEVMTMGEASKIGDVFITPTGCKNVLTQKHFIKMRDGVILANAGHFSVEIAVDHLKQIAV